MLKMVRLGSGEILPWDTHPSLVLLHQLKLFNFPIPSGIVFLHDELSTNPDNRLSLKVQQSLALEDLSSPISLLFFDRRASRPIEEIQIELSSLGEIELPFSPADALFMSRVSAQIGGVAISRTGYFTDEVTFQISTDLGSFPAQTLMVDKLGPGELPIRGDFRGRLQDLLRSLRRALGEDDLKIEWKDTGDSLYLTLIQRYNSKEVQSSASNIDCFFEYPDWNIFAGPIPPLKGALVEQSSYKLSKYFLHWAKELSPSRKFVVYREGKILFNSSFLRDFLNTYGIPSQLLSSKDLLSEVEPSLFKPLRTWKKLPQLIRFFHELTLATGLANRVTQKISAFQTSPEKTFLKLFHEWQTLFIASSHALFRLGFFKKIFFYKKASQKSEKAEKTLRIATQQALERVEEAIQLKAVGWYSRGFLKDENEIWSLGPQEISEKETLTFSRE